MSRNDGTGAGRSPREEERKLPRWLVLGTIALCVLLVLAQLVVPVYGPFAVQKVFGFYAICGFVAGAILMAGASVGRRFLTRDEDYYDR